MRTAPPSGEPARLRVARRDEATATALVLGGGGIVGMAYHVGVLAALEDLAGFDARNADLVVGTSAGAVIAAMLRGGTPASSLYRQLMSLDGGQASFLSDPQVALMLKPASEDLLGNLRRRLGSADLSLRTFGVPVPRKAAQLLTSCPAGVRDPDALLQVWSDVFPASWPRQRTYICAFNVSTRRRVVFGAPGAAVVDMAAAVHASGAVPWMYPPLILDGQEIVDGGLDSPAHLDLAAGYRTVIAVIPSAFDPQSPQYIDFTFGLPVRLYARWLRTYTARGLRSELEVVKAAGGVVALVRPTRLEADKHGLDLMDPRNRRKVADKAYREASASLRRPGSQLAKVLGSAT